MSAAPQADVCLIVEGAYPYVAGGVSSWIHDLLQAQQHLSFHLVVLCANEQPGPRLFELPANVLGVTEIALQTEHETVPTGRGARALVQELEPALQRFLVAGTRAELQQVLQALRRHPGQATRAALLNSEPAFEMLQRIYEASVPDCSFLRYFWSWRSLVGGLFAVLLAPLPSARVYHAISTGYAGLVMARAVLETGRAGLLTEHGIYTNERRIEIAIADWLSEDGPAELGIERPRRDLRDFWLDAFSSYARTCYGCSSRIVTLYAGNQVLQGRDGAPPERMAVIPNGVDVARYAAVPRSSTPRRPTVALIGRVVPIKDLKTLIRATALLRAAVPGVLVLVLGPLDEDPAYVAECRQTVTHLGLDGCIEFKGRVSLADHLGRIDVVVLTSLSEAQPLVLLEAGAAGVPCVATDVGSCRDIIEGAADESPALGPGGFVTPLANPQATAQALADLLLDPALNRRCAQALQERTRLYYSKDSVDARYRALYQEHLQAGAAPVPV